MGPLAKSTNKDDIKQAFDEIEEYVEAEDADLSDRRAKRLFSWAISAGVHCLLILVFAYVVFVNKKEEIDLPPIKIAIVPLPDKIDKPKPRDLEERVKDIEIKTDLPEVENPVISNLDLPVEEHNTESETNEDSVAKGREEAVSDSEMGGAGVFTSLGAGGGSSGLLGSRTGTGKQRAKGQLGQYGRAVDGGIDAGLRWLKRHQSPNGSWDAEKFTVNCEENPKCEPGAAQKGDTTAAMTAYALLCFQGAGYDHKTPNKFSKVVSKGLAYLLSIQKPDGLIGERNYEHAIATMALAEALAMTGDLSLKTPAQNATNVILARQAKGNKNDPYSDYAWDYVNPNPSRNDTSVSGWMALSLKSCLAAGLNVGNGLDGVKHWLTAAWKSSNPNWKTLDSYGKSVFPYTYNAATDTSEKDHLSAVGALCAVFTGHLDGDIMLDTLMNDARARWIDSGAFQNNDYMVYYLSLSTFQTGKVNWDSFLNTVVPYIIQKQRVGDGCFDGSWDYSHQKYHGHDTGRVLSTCLNLLSIEVAYRYAKVTRKK